RLGHVLVAARVLAEPVEQQHDGSGGTRREPALVVDRQAVDRRLQVALGVTGRVVHGARVCHRAQSSATSSASNSSYVSTAGKAGNSSRTFGGARNRKPRSAADSIDVSLYESPAASTRYRSDWNASTA